MWTGGWAVAGPACAYCGCYDYGRSFCSSWPLTVLLCCRLRALPNHSVLYCPLRTACPAICCPQGGCSVLHGGQRGPLPVCKCQCQGHGLHKHPGWVRLAAAAAAGAVCGGGPSPLAPPLLFCCRLGFASIPGGRGRRLVGGGRVSRLNCLESLQTLSTDPPPLPFLFLPPPLCLRSLGGSG